MNSNEVTLAVLIDFSKAFDTISHEAFIKKLNNLGFGKDFITWVLSYLSDRKQYIQVDDKKSSICRTYFGVPQGSILGPVLFNLYVNDLQDQITGCSKVLKYADDTTLYVSRKPKSIDEKCVGLNQSLADVKKWSEENNLSVNALKTKFITFSTSQLSKRHDLEQRAYNVEFAGKKLERVDNTRLLGIQLDSHLKWNQHVKQLLASVYGKLTVLKKLKNFTDFKLRKQLAQSLLLSKIDFNDVVFSSLTTTNMKKLNRLLLAVASFVYSRYATQNDIIKLNWLPIQERRDYNYLKAIHKAIYDETWPDINVPK